MISGSCGVLANYIEHYTFSKGLTGWFDKHNGYSSFEAIEGRRLQQDGDYGFSDLCASDALVRRRALKRHAVLLPFRAIAKFIYLYLLNFGFLDGRPGFRYCVLQSLYEYMIVLKIDELDRKDKGLSV